MVLFGLASCDIQIDESGFKLVTTTNEATSETVDDAWSAYPDGITVVSSARYTIDELFAQYANSYLSGMSDSEKANTQLGFQAFCKASIADYDIPSTDEKYWEIASVTYDYHGVTLPGSLIWCTDGSEHKPINPRDFVIDSHWTMTGAEEFPSVSKPPVIALAHMDAVYVCPDQMAAGEAQPYLCEAITADRTLAMVKAAMGFLRERGMSPLKVCEGYSIGYSQGGASALAVHRAIEQDADLCKAMGFCGTYSGAGPYNMELTLNEWIAQGTLEFPAAIGLIALAWDNYYAEQLGGYSAENYFLSANYRNSGALTDIAARSSSIGTINNKITSYVGTPTIANLLADDWKTNANYHFLEIAQSNNLLTGWTPTHPIVFFHSTQDEVVPYANTQQAVSVFPASLVKKFDQEGNHSEVGVKFYSWLGLQKGFPDQIHQLMAKVE